MDPNFHVSCATFSHVFQDFSKTERIRESPACWIQNLPWKIFIEPLFRDNRKYLSVYVGCTEPAGSSPWSCSAVIKMYKLYGTKPKIVRTTQSLVFDSSTSSSWGHNHFVLWDTITDPKNGFIKNDSITLEVTLEAEVPIGLALKKNRFTDERANNILAKLKTELEELKKQNKLQLESPGTEASNDPLKSKLEEFNVEREKYQSLLNTAKTYNQELHEKYLEQQSHIQELTKQLNESIQKEKTTINELKAVLEQKAVKIRDIVNEKEILNAELSDLKTKLNDATAKLSVLQSEHNNLKSTNQKGLEELDSKCEELRSRKDIAETEVKNLNEKILRLQEELSQKKVVTTSNHPHEYILKLQDCNKTVAQLQKENAELSNKIKKLEATSKDIQKLQKEKEELSKNLNQSQAEVQQLTEQIHNLHKRTTQTEDSSLSIDLSNGKLTKTKCDVSSRSDEKNSELIEKYRLLVEAKNQLQRNIDDWKTHFEKKINESDIFTAKQRAKYEKMIEDLQLQVNSLKKTNQSTIAEKKSVADELEKCRRDNQNLSKLKNDILNNTRIAETLAFQIFMLLVEIVKMKKQEGLSCNLQSRLDDVAGSIRAIAVKTENIKKISLLENVSTEQLLQKLNQLEIQMKTRLEILTEEHSKEQSRNQKLQITITKLKMLLENEKNLSRMHRESNEITDKRFDDLKNQYDELDDKLFLEKQKTYRLELKCDSLSGKMLHMNTVIEELKGKIFGPLMDNDTTGGNSFSVQTTNNISNSNEVTTDSMEEK